MRWIVVNSCFDRLCKIKEFSFVKMIFVLEEEWFFDEGEGENWLEEILFQVLGELLIGYCIIINFFILEKYLYCEIFEILGIFEVILCLQFIRVKVVLKFKLLVYVKVEI